MILSPRLLRRRLRRWYRLFLALLVMSGLGQLVLLWLFW